MPLTADASSGGWSGAVNLVFISSPFTPCNRESGEK